MAHPATKKHEYWTQLAILLGITGAGFLIGSLASVIPLAAKTDLGGLAGLSSKEAMKKLFVPENANLLRVVQFISTLFLFFLPAFFYARICHRKPFAHLGLKKTVTIPQAVIVILIMLACLPLVGALTELTEMLPFSESTFAMFKEKEAEYEQQINIIGRMNNFGEYIISLFMLAILPAVFEEALFRGAVQNLLSRWWRMPVLAIIVTSLLFSAVHFSYLGFLSRAVLGFVLGWMYYRTGNLWLNILAHGVNNAVAITALYITRQNNPSAGLSGADPEMPAWWGLISLAVVTGLFIVFEKLSKRQVDKPGEETLLEYEDSNNPSWTHQSKEKDSLN
jgi:membrane protease YdiL (CAAX protease family)